MSRAKRFILLAHTQNPAEAEAVQMVKAAPDREGAAFLRALLLLGFEDIKKQTQERKRLVSLSEAQILTQGGEV